MEQNRSQPQFDALPLAPPTQVDQVMTRSVMTLCPNDSFGAAVNLMATRHVRHSVVVDNAGKVLGVISDRDVLRALARNPDWQSKAVTEIMTPNPVVVRVDTPLTDALGELLVKRINCLPVVLENGSVCGILTTTDLLKSYKQLLESCSQER